MQKASFEPDSNQRPMDFYVNFTVHRSTNWAIEGHKSDETCD